MDIIVIWIDNVDLVHEVAFLETEDTARVCKVKSTVLVIEIPLRCQFELACTDRNGCTMSMGCRCC